MNESVESDIGKEILNKQVEVTSERGKVIVIYCAQGGWKKVACYSGIATINSFFYQSSRTTLCACAHVPCV